MKFNRDLGNKKTVVLRMDGNNKAPKADGQFVNAPYFNFNDDKLKFDTNDVDDVNPNYGSASALLPVCHISQKESITDSFLFLL